jgi:hypothetical protein
MNTPFQSLRRARSATALLLAACAATLPAVAAAADRQPVTLRFAAQVNGQPFACGQRYADIGTTRSTITPGDFRFYVSEVALVDEAGRAVPVTLAQDGMWQLDNLALLDFEDGSGPCRNGTAGTNTEVRGSVPAGRYTGLRFTLGVPFARNHGARAAEPHRPVLELAGRLQVRQVRHRLLGAERGARNGRGRTRGRRGLGFLGAPGQHGVRLVCPHRGAVVVPEPQPRDGAVRAIRRGDANGGG